MSTNGTWQNGGLAVTDGKGPNKKTTWANAAFPIYLGHRGSDDIFAPENTIAAFDNCIGLGADGIEFDTYITSDKKIVVIHDTTLDATTDMTGDVNKMKFCDVRCADAAAKFNPSVFSKQTIPTFEEVLNRYGGKTLMLPEIKSYGLTAAQATDYAQNAARVITENRLESYAVIQSFDSTMLAAVKSINPKIKTMLNFNIGVPLSPISTLLSAQYFAVGMYVNDVTQQIVTDLENSGIKIMVYGIQSISEMETLLTYSNHFIFVTDDAGFHKDFVNKSGTVLPVYINAPKKYLGSGFRINGNAPTITSDGITFPTPGDSILGLGIKTPIGNGVKVTAVIKTGTINADLTRYFGIMACSPVENPKLTWINSNQAFYHGLYKANGSVELGKTQKGGTVASLKSGAFNAYGNNETVTIELRIANNGFIGFKNVTTGQDINITDASPLTAGGWISFFTSAQSCSLQSVTVESY